MEKTNRLNSILVIDDDDDTLEFLAESLKKEYEAIVITTQRSTEAIKLSNKYFYDIILIDVNIDYRGIKFGGLEIYKQLLPRYGEKSLLAYSKYINNEYLELHEYNFNFILKDTSPFKFLKKCIKEIDKLRKSQTAFIAIPFNNKFSQHSNIIKQGIKNHGYRPVRIDEENFTHSIINKIFDEILYCKFVIFFATDSNPNVFYECGFADSMKKEIITIIDNFQNLPFDIKDRNAIQYKNQPKNIQKSLTQRIATLTKVPPH